MGQCEPGTLWPRPPFPWPCGEGPEGGKEAIRGREIKRGGGHTHDLSLVPGSSPRLSWPCWHLPFWTKLVWLVFCPLQWKVLSSRAFQRAPYFLRILPFTKPLHGRAQMSAKHDVLDGKDIGLRSFKLEVMGQPSLKEGTLLMIRFSISVKHTTSTLIV